MPFPKQLPVSSMPTRVLERVVSDVCGPFPNSLGHFRYFLSFIDAYSHYACIYMMKEKTEVPHLFSVYHRQAERLLGVSLLELFTDNGTEYVNQTLKSYCDRHGIIHRTNAPYSPASLGIAERYNRTLEEGALVLRHQSGLSIGFWPEAIESIAYTRNRAFHSSIGTSPYHLWYQKLPGLQYLRVFGSKVYIFVP